jgi:hypothetical protein
MIDKGMINGALTIVVTLDLIQASQNGCYYNYVRPL